MSSSTHAPTPHPAGPGAGRTHAARIDVRGPRFAAAVTATVLATAFLLRAPWLVAVQLAVFAVGSVLGVARAPYGLLFRALRNLARLGPPRRTEPAAPPRFSQLLGAVVLAAALASFALGADTLAWGLALTAFAAALLNATVGLCLGCELYLAGQRLAARGRPA